MYTKKSDRTSRSDFVAFYFDIPSCAHRHSFRCAEKLIGELTNQLYYNALSYDIRIPLVFLNDFLDCHFFFGMLISFASPEMIIIYTSKRF